MMRLLRAALAFFVKSIAVIGILAILASATAIWWFRRQAERPPVATQGDVVVPRGTRAIELWFPDERGTGLVLESREVVEDVVEGDQLVRTVVNEYLRGPDGKDARAALPEGTTIAHVYRDPSGGLHLDFGGELRRTFRGGSTAEHLLVASLLRTVAANAPAVSRVTLTAGGQPIVTLGGHVRLDGPLVVSEWR